MRGSVVSSIASLGRVILSDIEFRCLRAVHGAQQQMPHRHLLSSQRMQSNASDAFRCGPPSVRDFVKQIRSECWTSKFPEVEDKVNAVVQAQVSLFKLAFCE